MSAVTDRVATLAALDSTTFDVLVVGGGITGAGVALDAAARGLSVALVERDDFASGTSSRSSKLVHGGLRYLQQWEVGLVHEALAERRRALANAPHLVRVLPFLVPILTSGGLVDRRAARVVGAALWGYDLAGGLRIGRVHRHVGTDEAVALVPTLRRDRVAGAYLYYDAQADDARLTLAIVRTALAHGAVVANHATVTGLEHAHGRVSGARVAADGRNLLVRARTVVNACGVWADAVRVLDEPHAAGSLRPAKGVHLTLPWEAVRNRVAMVLPVPGDRRTVFVVPWAGHTYVGTTDTDYTGPLDEPACDADDVDYLLRALNAALVEPVAAGAVVATWAGLRPLLGDARSARTADLSRRHAVTVSAHGLVTVTGGKLTTYRRMAADAVDAAARALGCRERSRTKHLRLVGGEGMPPPVAAPDPEPPEHLAGRYGTEAPAVRALAAADPALARPLVTGLPYLRAEVVFAVRRELARTVDDVLSRRTRARVLDRDGSARAADDVAALMAPELGWPDAERAAQAGAYRAAVDAERAVVAP